VDARDKPGHDDVGLPATRRSATGFAEPIQPWDKLGHDPKTMIAAASSMALRHSWVRAEPFFA
jgi:hypothetical protein